MGRAERKALIKAIEKKRGSKVIAYVTSDRRGLMTQIMADAAPILHEHILELEQGKPLKLDLFLYSRGGESDMPWTIVSMFREYCTEGSFGVLVPYRAHSAATVIALGADDIVMTKKGELGPIDITMASGPYNPTSADGSKSLPISVEDVTGYFSLLDRIECERPGEAMKAFELLADKVHPLALGTVNRLLEQTKLVALRLLSTRAEPFPEAKNQGIITKLSSEVYSHSHTISRNEALKYLGLDQVKLAEDESVAEEMWDLYGQYRTLFALDEPFQPEQHLMANDLEEHMWADLPLQCVESEKRLDVLRDDLRVRRMRQIPPQVNMNIQSLSFPALTIAALPQGITPDQVKQIVDQAVAGVAQPILAGAVNAAAQALVRSMPQVGFERVSLKTRWEAEK